MVEVSGVVRGGEERVGGRGQVWRRRQDSPTWDPFMGLGLHQFIGTGGTGSRNPQ